MAAPPGREPEIVGAMLLEHGQHGATASGYVANALNFYLDRKYGRPFDPYPTPRDRAAHNLPWDQSLTTAEIIDYPVEGQNITPPTEKPPSRHRTVGAAAAQPQPAGTR